MSVRSKTRKLILRENTQFSVTVCGQRTMNYFEFSCTKCAQYWHTSWPEVSGGYRNVAVDTKRPKRYLMDGNVKMVGGEVSLIRQMNESSKHQADRHTK